MSKFKKAIIKLATLVIAFISIFTFSSKADDLEDVLSTYTADDIVFNEIYMMCEHHYSCLLELDAQKLMHNYGRSKHATTGLRQTRDADKSENFGLVFTNNRFVNCINHYSYDPNKDYVGNKNIRTNLGVIVDVTAEGKVTIYEEDKAPRSPDNESDRRHFETLACVMYSANKHNGEQWEPHPAAYIYNNYGVFAKYGVNLHYFDLSLSGALAMDTVQVDCPGLKLPKGTAVRFFTAYSYDKNGNPWSDGQTFQERIFFSYANISPGPGILRIKKVDESGKPLKNVTFMLKRITTGDSSKEGFIQVVNHAKGAYMKKKGDADNISSVPKDVIVQNKWDLRYTQKQEDATVFKTDDNGEIYIYGLWSGEYQLYEMVNPNYGYAMVGSNPKTITIKKGETTENEEIVQNEKITGNLRLIKRDKRTNAPLAGAGFKFQYIEGNNGNWLKDGNEYEKYTLNYNEAKEYFTDANGEIYLTDLLPGTYKAVETTAPEGYAALDKDKNGLTVYIPPKGTGEITVLNKKVGIFRKIIETTDVGLKNFEFTVREKSIREEYYQYFPNYFNPNDSMYKDPVGNVDFWVRDDHCEIVLKPDDDLRVTDTEDRWEVVGTTRKSRKVTKWREVSDGVDSEGNPKTKWESYEDTEWYDEDVYGWVTHITEWTCTTHGDKFGEFQESAAHQHCDTYNNKKAATKNELRENMEKYHAEREEGVRQTNTVVTDDKGYGDISKLVPDDDDYRGQMQIKEDNVGDNPYFNNDHPDFEDFVYYEKTVWTDVRRRMDIEGFIWEDLPKEGKEACKSREDGDSYYNEGEESLLGGIDVCLKNNAVGIIGKGTITADGRYRIRVGGRNGEDIKWVTTNKAGTYIEFTYNGLKYQCVYVDTANQKNGSNALETEASRANINERFKTITSNAGSIETSSAYAPIPTESKIIKYNHGNYESKIDYEVSFNEQIDYDKEALGDGRYNGTQRMVKASERDPETQQTRGNGDSSPCADNCYTYTSKTDGNNYQISARTDQTAFDGIARYTVAEDKIEDVSFGVYEREQPDISVVNDIERVEISVNGEKYIYQYGKKLENPDNVLEMTPSVRFQSNTTYKYKREIHGEHVKVDQEQQNPQEKDKFKLKIFYKTVVKNNSTNLTMELNEVVSQYDKLITNEEGLQVQDATSYMTSQLGQRNTMQKEIVWSSGDNSKSQYKTHDNSYQKGDYQLAYGYINQKIAPNDEIVFYTSYTVLSDKLLESGLIEQSQEYIRNNPTGEDLPAITLNNNIEVNAYTTTWDGQERNVGTDAYAGYDIDSAPGNSNINDKTGYEDDNDEAPSLDISLSEVRTITGNVYEDIPELINNEYLGNGRNDNEPKIQDVKVELVEIDKNGNEILDQNGDTKVLAYDWKNMSKSNPEKASTFTNENGQYEIKGFLPGEYIIKFTWGQDVDGKSSKYTDNNNNTHKCYVQQYKSTVFNQDTRKYSDMIDKKNTSGENPQTTKNRWYQNPNNFKKLSNAIDDMTTRRWIDNQTENIGQDKKYKGDQNNQDLERDPTIGNTLVYPDLEDPNYNGNLVKSIASRSPAFDVGIEDLATEGETVNERSYGKTSKGVYGSDGKIVNQNNRYEVMNVTDLDFGISERPKTDMQLEKRIDRVKLTLANGTVLVDATVQWQEDNGKIVGTIQNVSYPQPQRTNAKDKNDRNYRNDIGIFKMEMDKEILHGATLETTYKLTIKNTSNLDYDVVAETSVRKIANSSTNNKIEPANVYNFNTNKNSYYKFGKVGTESKITISPTKIIEYLDNKMGYRRTPEENAPKENDLWEEITEKENSRISDLLYDGRFENSTGYAKTLYDSMSYNNYSQNIKNGTSGEPNIKQQLENYIYKQYRTILRDVSKDNLNKLDNLDQNDSKYYNSSSVDPEKKEVTIKLEPGETWELKFVPSKQLADTETDLNYYNVVELAQLCKSSGAIPENIMVGNNDPTTTGPMNVLGNSPNWSSERDYHIITEKDGDYASVITIVPPTGSEINYSIIAWTVLGISSLGILTAGIVLIRKFVLKGKDK